MPTVTPDELDSVPVWHFAIGGLETQQETLDLGRPFRLRRLKQFPSHEQLAQCLSSLPVAGAVALCGEGSIRHELIIDAERFEEHTERIFPTAAAILAALRIRTRAEIVCPAVCERSWGALSSTPPNRCRGFHFERGHAPKALGEPKLLLPDDLAWVRQHLGAVVQLTDDERFQTGVEALCTYMLAAGERMQAAQLWAGIDAVFDVQHELQYRLATLTARLLAQPGPACRALFKEMKTLYGERSKIIHGRKIGDDKIRTHIGAVRGRLAEILTRLVELGKVPTNDEFEEMLFEK